MAGTSQLRAKSEDQMKCSVRSDSALIIRESTISTSLLKETLR